MNCTLLFIVVSFLVGLACGYGINKFVDEANNLTAEEYQILVAKINRDETIANDVKVLLQNQLIDYKNKVDAQIGDCHMILQRLIKDIKEL